MNNLSFEDFQKQTCKDLTKSKLPLAKTNIKLPVIAEVKPDTVEIAKEKTDENNIKQTNSEIQSKLDEAKKQNGLIEKLADIIKSKFNFGANSKQIQTLIDENKTDEEINSQIKKYRSSQENIAQTVGDVTSGAASISVFFFIKQFIQKNVAKFYTIKYSNNKDDIENLKKALPKSLTSLLNKIEKKSTAIIPALIIATIVGGVVKKTLLKLNRIGTKQYKADTKDLTDKKEIKKAKKLASKNKRNANFRNFVSGAINGLTAPLMVPLGAFGAPIYVAVNSLNKYIIANREDRGQKSIKGYIENLKASSLTHAIGAIGLLIPAIKSGKFNTTFDKNISKVIEKLKKAQLSEINTGTTYQQLEEIIFKDEKIDEIVNVEKFKELLQKQNPDLDISNLKEEEIVQKQIQALIDENIFAVKFKQIQMEDNDKLTEGLKERCPVTYSKDEVIQKLKATFGDKYEYVSSCGAGTVAETYIIQDKQSGKQYCIKMLKKGMDKTKIDSDYQKFLAMLENSDKTSEEKEFLIKNAQNIYESIVQEIDLKNEMNAANELAKVTKKAKVVKGIEVKDNIYVMEKADGISLETLTNYIKGSDRIEWIEWNIKRCQEQIECYSKLDENPYYTWYSDQINKYEKELNYYLEQKQELKKLEKEIGKIEKEEATKLLEAYQEVLVEQFSKVNEKGKIIHGDIHPGNIFIDVKALREGKKDFLTLIDTGNTINQGKEQAVRFLNLSKYINNADYENITNFVLEGAKLPEGMTKEQAQKAISDEIKKAFFDTETHIGYMNNDTLFNITDNAMQKLNIIPSDAQASLTKAKASAERSQKKLEDIFSNALGKQLEDKFKERLGEDAGIEDIRKNFGFVAGQTTKAGADMAKTHAKYPLKKSIQERKNLSLLSPKERIKIKKSKTTPKKNSEDYLTYFIKQGKASKEEKNKITIEDILGL